MEEAIWTNELKDLVKRCKTNQNYLIFCQPIEEIIDSHPKYCEVIEQPIDAIKIENKVNDEIYNDIDEFKNEMDLMFANCKTFNPKQSWAHKAGEAAENFFNREYKKSISKIEKNKQILQTQLLNKKYAKVESKKSNTLINDSMKIVSSAEDERTMKKIRNLFVKISSDMDVSETQREEIITLIMKSIIKRSKSFDQIYDDTMKFLTKHLKNQDLKSHFSKKFRKILRIVKEEQNAQIEGKAFNIKINLNESEGMREEKDRLEQIRKEVLNFIDNQKIPERMRNTLEYPIEPSLRKKILTHVNDIRNEIIYRVQNNLNN